MERQPEWDLVIKVKHGDTLRRIGARVRGQLMDLNMSKLKSKIISLFKFRLDAEIILTYTDEDGDVVMLDDDDEFCDAIIGQRLNPLRINVQLKSADNFDASSKRSSPPNSVGASLPEIPPLTPEPLLGVVSDLIGIALKATSSSPAIARTVDDVVKSEPFRSAMECLSKDVKKATSFSAALAQVIEHLSNLDLANAGQTSSPNEESSGITTRASTHQMDVNATEEPKGSNGPILVTTELRSNTTSSVGSIHNQNGSGNMEGTGAVDRNMNASKNAKASLYPYDDLLASMWTANHSAEHAEAVVNANLDGRSGEATVTSVPPPIQTTDGSGNLWMPMQPYPSYMNDAADIMGGCSSIRSPMKADFSSPSQTGFNSHVEVPISGQMGTTPCDEHPMLLLSEVMKVHHRHHPRRSHIINENTSRTFHRGVQCDGCGMHPIVGPRFKSNVKEDYDLCNICFAQMGNGTDYTRIDYAHHRAPRLLKGFHNHVLHGCGVRPHRAKLESRFIQDVTVLDGTVMLPSTHFTKIWRLRNNGNVPWPFGTQLVWVGGDQFGNQVSADLEISPSGFPVDKELDIAVDLTAPSRPGRYVSYWRMASPSGQKFGQRVWVLIQVEYSPPNSAAGSSFYPDLNLNLPPESSGRNGSVIIDVNAEPFDSGFSETDFNGTNEGLTRPVVEDVPTGPVEQPAQVVGDLLDANSSVLSQLTPAPAVASPSASYPLIDLQMTPSMADTSSPVAAAADDGSPVEQTLLKELEEMGFKQIDLNKEILRLNEYDLEQSVDDLCGFAQWDPLLSELREMGFNDRELNKKLLIKNGGSIKRTVLDLISGKASE